MADMVDRSSIKGKTIVIADRGYESYNNFAHIERKGWNYVIRVKDLDSSGILSSLRLPASGVFDQDVDLTLTRKQTKAAKAYPGHKFLPSNSTFDFLDSHEKMSYLLSIRVVRFVLPDGAYETAITNLSAADFPPDEIKSIYHMRWGIETSFRALKYTVGLTNFHASKNILPIRPLRPGQLNTRKIRYKSAVSFVYRVA